MTSAGINSVNIIIIIVIKIFTLIWSLCLEDGVTMAPEYRVLVLVFAHNICVCIILLIIRLFFSER